MGRTPRSPRRARCSFGDRASRAPRVSRGRPARVRARLGVPGPVRNARPPRGVPRGRPGRRPAPGLPRARAGPAPGPRAAALLAGPRAEVRVQPRRGAAALPGGGAPGARRRARLRRVPVGHRLRAAPRRERLAHAEGAARRGAGRRGVGRRPRVAGRRGGERRGRRSPRGGCGEDAGARGRRGGVFRHERVRPPPRVDRGGPERRAGPPRRRARAGGRALQVPARAGDGRRGARPGDGGVGERKRKGCGLDANRRPRPARRPGRGVHEPDPVAVLELDVASAGTVDGRAVRRGSRVRGARAPRTRSRRSPKRWARTRRTRSPRTRSCT